MPRKRKVAVPNQENIEPPVKVVEKPKKVDQNEKPAKKQKREPEFLTGDGLNVIKVILTVQKTDCNSSKCLTELKKLYEKVNIDLSLFVIIANGSQFTLCRCRTLLS